MSLHRQLIPPVPEETARVARAAFPKGNLYLRMRDELGVFHEDQQYAHMYPTRGQVRGQQRTDSTYVSAAVREMTRLEFLGETLGYALNALAQAAPIWLQSQVPSNWYDRYGTRFEDSRLPKPLNSVRHSLLVSVLMGFDC